MRVSIELAKRSSSFKIGCCQKLVGFGRGWSKQEFIYVYFEPKRRNSIKIEKTMYVIKLEIVIVEIIVE